MNSEVIREGDLVRTKSRMWTHKAGSVGICIEIKYTIGGSVYYKLVVEGKRNHWHGEWNVVKTTKLEEALRET
jgi:hypothetical protein